MAIKTISKAVALLLGMVSSYAMPSYDPEKDILGDLDVEPDYIYRKGLEST